MAITPVFQFPPPQGAPQQAEKISEEVNKAEEKPATYSTGPFTGLPLALQKGSFSSHKPYISCNERLQEETLNFFSTRTKEELAENRVHLGFSVWFNFDLISITQPKYAIICDFDNKVLDIYQAIGECLTLSESPEEFVNQFEDFLLAYLENLRLTSGEDLKNLFDLKAELSRPGSWLSSNEKFLIIKKMHETGSLLFLNLDITSDKGVFVAIRDWMQEQQLVLDTLYTSNIVEWMDSDLKKQAYLLNLKTVVMEMTQCIYACKSEGKGSPQLFIEQGSEGVKIPKIQSLKSQKNSSENPENPQRQKAPRRLNF